MYTILEIYPFFRRMCFLHILPRRQELYSATSQMMMTNNQYISLCNKKSIFILTKVSMEYG